jgi:ABC-2 type transport system permease protein
VIAVVRSEAFKLRTTRTFFGITLGAIALVLLISIGGSVAGTFHAGDTPLHDILGVAALAQLFALVLGVLAVSTEFRHGTITPSLLAVPSRTRLVLGKVIAYGLSGLALGIVAFGLAAIVISAILSARGVDSGTTTSDALKIVVGGGIAAGLYAVLGVGVGTLLRNQAGAIVVSLAWVFVVESLLQIINGISHAVAKFGVGGLASGLSGTAGSGDHVLGQVAAGIVLACYAAVLVVAGVVTLQRRDVSA